VPLKEVILLGLGAVRALKAADEEHGHANRYQHGEHARIRHEPMSQGMHSSSPDCQMDPQEVCRDYITPHGWPDTTFDALSVTQVDYPQFSLFFICIQENKRRK
jgi:hypothetical protein